MYVPILGERTGVSIAEKGFFDMPNDNNTNSPPSDGDNRGEIPRDCYMTITKLAWHTDVKRRAVLEGLKRAGVPIIQIVQGGEMIFTDDLLRSEGGTHE